MFTSISLKVASLYSFKPNGIFKHFLKGLSRATDSAEQMPTCAPGPRVCTCVCSLSLLVPGCSCSMNMSGTEEWMDCENKGSLCQKVISTNTSINLSQQTNKRRGVNWQLTSSCGYIFPPSKPLPHTWWMFAPTYSSYTLGAAGTSIANMRGSVNIG